ncbi:hypothetical protein [Liquorilactobacillus satsumensis]|uniref:hypothetical protein n=1 Tax=Liquorilactobacillus satsumensis TaxID=259059 RepID=UPI0039E8AB45
MKIFNWCKKHLIWALIILLCLIPLSINILFLCPLFDWGGGDDSGWLGFWGGYLGVAVSAIGAYVTYKQHLQDNERKSKPYFILKYMNDLNDVDKKLIKVVYKNRRTTSNNSEEESKKDEVKELINNITNENVPILALQAKIINPITDIYIKVNTIRPTGNAPMSINGTSFSKHSF